MLGVTLTLHRLPLGHSTVTVVAIPANDQLWLRMQIHAATASVHYLEAVS